MRRTESELWAWRRSKVTRSLSRWTGNTSGEKRIRKKSDLDDAEKHFHQKQHKRKGDKTVKKSICFHRERPAAISIEIKSIDDTSNFDDFPESDILQPGLSALIADEEN